MGVKIPATAILQTQIHTAVLPFLQTTLDIQEGMPAFQFSGFLCFVRTPALFKASFWLANRLCHKSSARTPALSGAIFFSCSRQSVGSRSTELGCSSISACRIHAQELVLQLQHARSLCNETHGQIYIALSGSNNGPLSSCGCPPLHSQALSAQEMPVLTDR